jgi:hypothetical protein
MADSTSLRPTTPVKAGSMNSTRNQTRYNQVSNDGTFLMLKSQLKKIYLELEADHFLGYHRKQSSIIPNFHSSPMVYNLNNEG